MNTLYYGDNLKILRDYIKDESVDRIYLVMVTVVMLAIVLSSCNSQPRSVEKVQSFASNLASPGATPGQSITPADQARVLVGLDKQTTAANADDIRVKRVQYLLEELVRKTGEDMTSIAAETDSTSNFIENKYGREISRQKLLEEMKSFYSNPKLKLKPSYKEAITVHALLEYAK